MSISASAIWFLPCLRRFRSQSCLFEVVDGLQDRISGVSSCSCFPYMSRDTNMSSKKMNQLQKNVRITPSQVKPALLTMMWILPPPNSAAFFTSSSMYCTFNISPGIAVACPPPCSMALATAFALSVHQGPSAFTPNLETVRQLDGDVPASISCTTTFAPSCANNCAASAPMPCPEPVMMAT